MRDACAVSSIQYSVFRIPYSVFRIQYSVFSVQYRVSARKGRRDVSDLAVRWILAVLFSGGREWEKAKGKSQKAKVESNSPLSAD